MRESVTDVKSDGEYLDLTVFSDCRCARDDVRCRQRLNYTTPYIQHHSHVSVLNAVQRHSCSWIWTRTMNHSRFILNALSSYSEISMIMPAGNRICISTCQHSLDRDDNETYRYTLYIQHHSPSVHFLWIKCQNMHFTKCFELQRDIVK